MQSNTSTPYHRPPTVCIRVLRGLAHATVLTDMIASAHSTCRMTAGRTTFVLVLDVSAWFWLLLLLLQDRLRPGAPAGQ